MNNNQKILITLLSAAIRGKQPSLINKDDIDWNEVYIEAEAQAISPLIYPIIKRQAQIYKIDNDLLTKWSKTTIISSIYQIQHINQMRSVFKAFEEAKIPIIALKGLVLRDLYPKPEFRSMSDSDLLINRDYAEVCENILIKLGYSKNSTKGYESCFTHSSALPIDLHYCLTNKDHLKNVDFFEASLWKNLRIYNFRGIDIHALSLEYELIHLFVHIASHMIKSGFGLRQLCDIVQLIEKEEANINWDIVYYIGDLCKLNKLISIILKLCYNLLELKIPNIYASLHPESEEYIEFLINEVFDNGVFGGKNEERITSIKLFNHSFEHNDKNNTLKLLLRYLFPSGDNLDSRYSYASRHHFLLPFAWIHRLIYCIFFNNTLKLRALIRLKSTASITENKFRLIKWLQLR